MPATDSTNRRTSASERLVRAGVTLAVLAAGLALLAAARNRWEWGRVLAYGPLLLRGLVVTAWVSLLGMALGLALGLAGGIGRLSRRAVPNQLAATYVELVRGTPLLVQVYLAYYVVWPAVDALLQRAGVPPSLGDPDRATIVVGVLTIGVFAGAYVTEIVRAAIESVDPGQTEAALAQGMTPWQVFRLVLFPQALRRMIPPLAGQFVSLVKDSSLLSVIAVPELTKRALEAHANTYKPFEVFLLLAALYLALTLPLSRLARRLELALA